MAALVELPSGKAPKALVWTDGRAAEWRTNMPEYTTRMNNRRKRLAELESHNGNRGHVNQLDAYIAAPGRRR